MIRLLTGKPVDHQDEVLILDVHGVGYEVWVPTKELQIARQKDQVTLHIYTFVREEALSLYGFLDPLERRMFELLLSVSGVGPKSALSVVDKGAQAVVEAIQQSEVGFFQSVPRLGKKTAQKIILELQSKVGSLNEFKLTPQNQLTTDVRDALLNLGYNEGAIETVLSRLQPDWEVTYALKWSLQNIGNNKIETSAVPASVDVLAENGKRVDETTDETTGAGAGAGAGASMSEGAPEK